MNRSTLTLSLAAQAMLSASASAFILNDTRRAGPLDDNYSLGLTNIGTDDSPDAGGPDVDAKKVTDDVTLAKGETIGDDTQKQQQAQAMSAAAPGTELDANKVGTDVAALNSSEGKAAIGEPASGQTQQT